MAGMKALTIWQPWASLLACGAKRFETRSWATSYRGPIAIHAAKKNVSDVLCILPVSLARKMKESIGTELKELPTGAVIATAELVNVWNIAYHPGTYIPRLGDYFVPEKERDFGDWTPGRFAWEFSNMKLITPVSAKGKQGLWNFEMEVSV